MSIAPEPDNFESEIDAAIAELHAELSDADRANIDRWLNTPIDSETADAIDAEIDAFFDGTDDDDLVPFGADHSPDPSGDGDSEPCTPAGHAETSGVSGLPAKVNAKQRRPKAGSFVDYLDEVEDYSDGQLGANGKLDTQHLEQLAKSGISPSSRRCAATRPSRMRRA